MHEVRQETTDVESGNKRADTAAQQKTKSFNKGSQSREHLRKLLAMLIPSVAAAIVIVCLGPVAGCWFGAFAMASAAAIAILIVCIISIAPTRLTRRWPSYVVSVVRLILLVWGMVLLMLPVALFVAQYPQEGTPTSGDPALNAFIGILTAMYSAVQMVGFEMSLGDWVNSSVASWLLPFHAFLVFVFALACPVAAVFAAFNAFVNGFSVLRIRFLSWYESIGKKAHEIYVFHELDEHGYRLACDILEERGDDMPFLIFANVGDAEASRDETLMEDLVDRSKGKGLVVYTSIPAESIPQKLSRKAQQKCTIRYFAVSQISSANVTTTVMIWDALFVRLWDAANVIFDGHRSELVNKDDEDNPYSNFKALNTRLTSILEKTESEVGAIAESEDDALDNELARLVMLGSRMSIHCLHTYSEDSLILDGLAGRALETLDQKLGIAGPEDNDNKKPFYGLKDFVTTLCNLVEVRLISKMQVSVCDVLSEHPLYEALDEIDLRKKESIAEQQLTVLIIGAGAYGTEAIRTVFWLGRFARVRLRIVVVEREDVQPIMRRLYAEAPEMMCEHACREDDLGQVRGVWTYAGRYVDPTIMFCQMDAFDCTMDDLVSGKKIGAYYFVGEPGKARIERHEKVLMSSDDHVYSMVCLDTDDASLGAALLLQRRLGLRSAQAQSRSPHSVAARFLDGSQDAACKSPIALRVRNTDALASLSEMARDSPAGGLWDCGFPLYPFGSIKDLFSYAMIARDETEVRARQTNLAYDIVRSKMPRDAFLSRVAHNGRTEFLKMSNRSHAISIRYKLWMMGLEATCADGEYTEAFGMGEQAALAEFICEKGFFHKDRQKSVDGSLPDNFEEYERYVRSKLPVLCYMSDLEHVRWAAFHRAYGWRDAGPYALFAEDGAFKSLVNPSHESHKHEGLRLHYYLCDSIEDLRKRGENNEDDPHAYDRMLVRDDFNILRSTDSM